MSAFRDITHYFVRDGDPIGVQRGYLYGIRSSVVNGLDDLKVSLLAVNNIQKEDVYYDSGEARNMCDGSILENLEFDGIDHFVYNTNLTIQGDCGMLLMSAGQTVGSRKILGMHVAASTSTQEGVSCPVFQEQLLEAIAYFKSRGNRNVRMQLNEFVNFGLPQWSKMENDIIVNGSLNVVGTLKSIEYEGKKYQSYLPIQSKTNIEKSISFDLMEQDFGSNISKPAYLKPFLGEQGQIISPLCLALKKYQVNVRFLDDDDREEIVTHIVDTFNDNSVYPLERRRLLDDSECLNGYGAMKQIDISTSAGFPYTMIDRNGKRKWIKVQERAGLPNHYTADAFVMQNVNERIEMAKRGEIKSTIFCDTLKDETRPIEKVDKGKTRVFQIGPFDLTLAMRKYFGAFVDMCHTSYLSGEIAIGVDPNSCDWGNKLRRLTLNGLYGWAGDFGNYDASIWVQFAHWCADIINRWYNGSEEDFMVRLTLLLTLFHSYHALLNFVFVIYNGNPSGNLLTTILNCLVFMIMIRKIFLEVNNHKIKLSEFKKYISNWIYGDDNVVIFRDNYYIPFEWAQEFFAFYGMEYTDALKTGKSVGKTSIYDMTFLKRKWVKSEGDIWAPMPIENLLEIPRWSESDPLNTVDQMARYNASLLELSNHGAIVFNEVRRKYYKQIQALIERGHNFKLLDLFTYIKCYGIKRPFVAGAHCQMCDDLDLGLSVVNELGHASTLSETLKSIKFYNIVDLDSNNINDYGLARNFKIQSNETHGDDDSKVLTTTEKSTRFEDAPSIVVAVKDENKLPFLYRDSFTQDLRHVVGRPFLLTTFNWTANDTIGTEKFSAIFPFVIREIFELRQICLYHAYMRPEIEMMVQVNGTPMHYGRLMVSVGYVSRYYGDEAEGDAALTSMSNVNWLQISANSVRNASINVPWMAPVERFPVTMLFDQNYDESYAYAQMLIRVAVPLLINGNAVPSVGCSVYLIIREPNFSGWGIPGINQLSPTGFEKRAMRTQMLDNICEAVQSCRSGVLLSNITSDIATWISKFKKIPVIGAGASVVSSTVQSVSSVIKALGFAIPPNVLVTMPTFNRNARLMQCEDVSNAIPLAPVPNPYVVKDPEFVGSRFEDFDIATYLSHPTYFTQFKISGDMAAESVIFTQLVEPDLFICDAEIANYAVPTRMAFLSRLFYWWRGGIRFHFSFTASRFHSCRVRFTWYPFPVNDIADPNKPMERLTQNQLSTLPSIVFDVNGDSECSFTVPYMQPVEWKRLRDRTLEPTPEFNLHANGCLYISIVNPLVNSASEATNSGIFCQVFVSAAEDFQFAQPTLESIWGNGVYAPQLVPQTIRSQIDEVVQQRNFMTQMDDSNFSSEGLKKKKYTIIGGIDPGHRSENVHMSTNITSLKQLCSMGGSFSGLKFSMSEGGVEIIATCGNNMLPETNAQANSSLAQKNYLFQLAPAFGFYRGSMRVAFEIWRILDFGTTAATHKGIGPCTVKVVYDPEKTNMMFLSVDPLILDEVEAIGSEGVHSFIQNENSSLIFDVPWYSPFRFWPVWNSGLKVDTPKAILTCPVMEPTQFRITACIGGGDDFMMFWDSPMPAFWYGTESMPILS